MTAFERAQRTDTWLEHPLRTDLTSSLFATLFIEFLILGPIFGSIAFGLTKTVGYFVPTHDTIGTFLTFFLLSCIGLVSRPLITLAKNGLLWRTSLHTRNITEEGVIFTKTYETNAVGMSAHDKIKAFEFLQTRPFFVKSILFRGKYLYYLW